MQIRCCVFFLLLSFGTQAQKKLTGHVMIAGTKNPVGSVNVYLGTTSVGTITNEKGEFIIPSFPEGRFDLVVSCIGYETYHVLVQSARLPENLQIFLRPHVAELKEVIVENYDKDGWEKWGKIFLENFIGTSAFAYDCKLKNPDVIRLRLDKKTNTIRAAASDQLIIENEALGYILKYDLIRFEYNLSTYEFVYRGYPFFEEMKTDSKGREKRWERNRLIAYEGSLMHFMRSLHSNQLKEQQFDVREWLVVSDEEKQRVRKMSLVQLQKQLSDNSDTLEAGHNDTTAIINADTLAYYQSIMKQIDQKNILINILLSGNDLVFKQDSLSVGMKYKSHLQIEYRPKKPPFEYQKHLSFRARLDPVSSDIYRSTDNPIFILPNGMYYDAVNIITGRYWSWWEKMCTKLPYDYVPPSVAIKN